MASPPPNQDAGQWNWLLPQLIDHRALTEPNALYAEYPAAPTSYSDGLKAVTYGQLANAVNGAAIWLETTLGGKGVDHEVLAYMGAMDARYIIFIMAAIKTGYTLLLPSPRNSVAAQQNLLALTRCTKLLTTSPGPPFARPTTGGIQVSVHQVPSLDYLLEQCHPQYAYDKTFQEAKNDPFLILHTSGSTGLPKPIIYTQEFPVAYQNMMHLQPPKGWITLYSLFLGTRIYSMLPPFHIAGVVINMVGAIFNKSIIISILPLSPPTARGLLAALEKTEVDAVISSPLTCHEIVEDTQLLNVVARKVKYYFYGGGDCPPHVGEIMNRRMKFWGIIGQSEYGSLPQIRQEGEWATDEWRYLRINPDFGIEYRHFDGDTCEQWIVKKPAAQHAQPVFKVLPGLEEYCTKDLFLPHPSKPDLWTYQARLDDIIAFLNGEKTNPTAFEAEVVSHPEIDAALVVGSKRLQAALLIESSSAPQTTIQKGELIERVWHVIEEANRHCPAHAKIMRSHILFTTPEKPMLRASKGTIQRHHSLAQYAEEIDQLYEDADKQTTSKNKQPNAISSFCATEVSQLVEKCMLRITGWNSLDHEADFFALGLDSLQVLEITRQLKEEVDCPSLAPSIIYSNRTMTSLVTAMQALDRDDTANLKHSQADQEESMEAIFAASKEKIDQRALLVPPQREDSKMQPKARTVLLVGFTGAIGAHLLRVLLECDDVAHVYCLNRENDSEQLQAHQNGIQDRHPWDASRVTQAQENLSAQHFGLVPRLFDKLVTDVTDIIHADSPEDLDLNTGSFESEFAGIVELIAFSLAAVHKPKITLLVSIAAGTQLSPRRDTESVPKTVTDNSSPPDLTSHDSNGYLSERLLAYANKRHAVACSILRLGQVSGPWTKNVQPWWPEQHWFPSLVVSSAFMGAFPEVLGGSNGVSGDGPVIDWLPVDLVARIITELVGIGSSPDTTASLRKDTMQVFHLVNPQKTSWQALYPTVQEVVYASTGKWLAKVSLETWIRKLKTQSQELLETQPQEVDQDAASDEVASSLPAIKFLSTFENWVSAPPLPDSPSQVQTVLSEERSETLRNAGPITADMVAMWVEGWLPLA